MPQLPILAKKGLKYLYLVTKLLKFVCRALFLVAGPLSGPITSFFDGSRRPLTDSAPPGPSTAQRSAICQQTVRNFNFPVKFGKISTLGPKIVVRTLFLCFGTPKWPNFVIFECISSAFATFCPRWPSNACALAQLTANLRKIPLFTLYAKKRQKTQKSAFWRKFPQDRATVKIRLFS